MLTCETAARMEGGMLTTDEILKAARLMNQIPEHPRRPARMITLNRNGETMSSEFKQYRRKQIAELRPFVEGETLSGVSISDEDRKAGSPKAGDMIARNPANHADQWLVAEKYFAVNFEPVN